MIQIIAMAAFMCCLNPIFGNENHKDLDVYLSCNDNVQISIAGNCEGITPDHFLEGDAGVGAFVIQIRDTLQGIAPNQNSDFIGIDWSELIGAKGLEYKIIDANSAGCWGTLDLESNILPAVDLSPCAFIEGSTISTTATLEPGATDTYTFEITDECQSYTVNKTSGGLKVACDTDPSGWCVIDCDIEITDPTGAPLADLVSGTGLMVGKYTVSVSADNPTFSGIYDISIVVTDCVQCENWCDGPPPSEFVTLEELEEMLASSCMIDVELLSEKVFESGNICDDGGVLTVVKYAGQYDSHGETIIVDLMTQAYRSLPIDLYLPGTTDPNFVSQACTGSGTLNPIFCFPIDQKLSCGDDYTPEAIAAKNGGGAGFPTILDIHTDIPGMDINCREEHFEVTVDTVVAPVEISPGVWSNVKTVVKELRDTIICDTVPNGQINHPKYPLSNGLFCNIFVTHEDFVLSACGGSQKIVRNWKLLDWCTNTCFEQKQNIEIGGSTAPQLVGTVATEQSFDIDAIDCLADLTISPPTFVDDCNDNPTVTLELTENISGIWIDPSAVPIGEYTATYIANDGCGNLSEPVVIAITVTESFAPIAVCKDLIVSLTPDMDYVDNGIAKIYAEAFDKGSHDSGCGEIIKMEVIRMEDLESGAKTSCDPILEEVILEAESEDKFGDIIPAVTGLKPVFGEYVKFCCEDVGEDLQVVLQVHDNQGNSNQCMVNIQVQDKLSGGGLSCPSYTVNCLDFTDTPEENLPTILNGTCSDLEIELLSEDAAVGSCGAGNVIREWGAVQNGVVVGTCLQLVTVTAEGAFDPRDIKWPLHHTGEEFVNAFNKEPHPETGVCTLFPDPTTTSMNGILNCSDLENSDLCTPSFPGVACGLIGLSHEDETVVFDEGACLKIIRRWTVIDWCVYEPNSRENFDDNNDVADDTYFVCIDWCETDECIGNYYFKYDNVEEDGYYTFDQVLKIVDDQVPTVDCEGLAASSSFDGDACTGSITATATGQDLGDCPSNDLTWNIILKGADGKSVDIQSRSSSSGEEVSYSIDGLAEGSYTVCFVAIDACGNNSESCEIPVSIADTKAPTPICIQRLSTAVMQAGVPTVDIWAVDFNVKSEDNCTPQGDLRYSFSEDSIVGSVALDCDDADGFPVELKMWVWDNSDNKDFCSVEIMVDGELACFGEGQGMTAIVSGLVQTESGEMISNTDVSIESSHPEYPTMQVTLEDGKYAFMDNPMHLDYKVSAVKDRDYMNGVSTLDLVLMNKHILGTAILDSPYKIIAADINNSGTVSASDLVQLRKLILGLIDELPNNSSWRFLDADQSFLNPNNPWPFVEEIDMFNLEQNQMKSDFIGVKIGDVNGTAKANNLIKTEVRSNSNKVVINIFDQEVSENQIVNIEFNAKEYSELKGFQFTLANQDLEVIDILSNSAAVTQSNIGVFENQTTISYNNDATDFNSADLFTLVVKAKKDIVLSDALAINSRITSAEAYLTNELVVSDLVLEFENAQLSQKAAQVELYQNVPNPFNQNTSVSFSLPSKSDIKFQIHDYAGKLMFESKGQFSAGTNTIELDKRILKTSGIYYYTLTSNEISLTKSMIRIE